MTYTEPNVPMVFRASSGVSTSHLAKPFPMVDTIAVTLGRESALSAMRYAVPLAI